MSYRYRYEPAADYYTAFSIRNDSLLPATIVGPAIVRDVDEAAGPSPVDLRLARGVDQGDPWLDPRASPTASGYVVPAGEEVLLWVHWKTGNVCDAGRPAYTAGSSAGVEKLVLDWSTLGLPRTSDVPLGYMFEVANPAEDPLESCSLPS